MSDNRSSVFAWHDGFLVGHGPMDEAHEEFVGLVDALARSPDGQLVSALEVLLIHARQHFGDEERWMAETDFPARACHANEHAAVLQSIEAIRVRVAQGESDAARRLSLALIDWFPAHADYLDAALAHWICKTRLGGKPIVLRRRAEPPVSSAERRSLDFNS